MRLMALPRVLSAKLGFTPRENGHELAAVEAMAHGEVLLEGRAGELVPRTDQLNSRRQP